MEVSKVTDDDGRMMLQVINALKAATFGSLTSKDVDALAQGIRWLSSVATQMGNSMKASIPAKSEDPSSQSFKVKAIGPLGSPVSSKKSKRKK